MLVMGANFWRKTIKLTFCTELSQNKLSCHFEYYTYLKGRNSYPNTCFGCVFTFEEMFLVLVTKLFVWTETVKRCCCCLLNPGWHCLKFKAYAMHISFSSFDRSVNKLLKYSVGVFGGWGMFIFAKYHFYEYDIINAERKKHEHVWKHNTLIKYLNY